MSKKFLHHSNVGTVVKKMSRKTNAEACAT
jgi:hypothetical protein